LVDAISVGVDRMQRNFEPMRKQVELWRQSEVTDVTAKMIIYQAFIESEPEVPRHLARRVHDLYFERPSTTSSSRVRSGAYLTRLPPRLKIWRFRSSGQQPSSVVFSKPASSRASEI
jgi:hypothetical protein